MALAPIGLTKEQEQFLDCVVAEKSLLQTFYFTGGTPLAVFYLHHRESEDIDLFSEEEVRLPAVRAFLGKVQKKLSLTQIDYRQFLGLHSFQLFFSKENILKIDFNYYPFPRIERGGSYKGLAVDSMLDIAVNKVHTVAMKPRARDFIDLFFILRKAEYQMEDLIIFAKTKFDWHIDPIQLGSRFQIAAQTTDYPRMLVPIDHHEWKDFFLEQAKALKPQIFE